MATAALQQTTKMVIDIEDTSVINDLRRLLKHVSGLGKIRVSRAKAKSNVLTPELQKELSAIRESNHAGNSIVFENAKDAVSWMDSL